ncbi:MAG TPA: hypothetical protein VFW65_27385 [Pseudonocardiaceae bacterium]|nr:hypothetical protein [Pseudonocardiaceae bacterium]
MTRRPGGSDGPEDVDAAFAEIVADLEREGLGALIEADEFGVGSPSSSPSPEPPVDAAPPAVPPPPVPDPPVEWDDEEHFVPPEPPPLPKMRPSTIFGIVLLVIGGFLLAAPSVIGLEPRIATPLALVSMAAGIGWLVLRMRQGPPPDSGWDDGAQL